MVQVYLDLDKRTLAYFKDGVKVIGEVALKEPPGTIYYPAISLSVASSV